MPLPPPDKLLESFRRTLRLGRFDDNPDACELGFRTLVEMLLFADGIGFADPALHLGIEFFFRRDAEFMDVAARSELLDLPKPGMVVPAGKPEPAEQRRFPEKNGAPLMPT